MQRERPLVISTRVTPMERARILALCAAEGVSVSELVHGIVISEVNSRLVRDLAGHG